MPINVLLYSQIEAHSLACYFAIHPLLKMCLTVTDDVPHRYCIFSLLLQLLKMQNLF